MVLTSAPVVAHRPVEMLLVIGGIILIPTALGHQERRRCCSSPRAMKAAGSREASTPRRAVPVGCLFGRIPATALPHALHSAPRLAGAKPLSLGPLLARAVEAAAPVPA